MDDTQFDHLARAAHSRRTALASLAGVALTLVGRAGAEAHNPIPACKKITNPKRKRACLRKGREHNAKHRCQNQNRAAICRGLCGRAFNNCGQAVDCPCPAGKTCLSNGSCARACSVAQPACPAGCTCLGPEVGGSDRCIQAGLSCTVLTQGCATTADCQPGSFCLSSACLGPSGFENRCAPLCAA